MAIAAAAFGPRSSKGPSKRLPVSSDFNLLGLKSDLYLKAPAGAGPEASKLSNGFYANLLWTCDEAIDFYSDLSPFLDELPNQQQQCNFKFFLLLANAFDHSCLSAAILV